MSFIRARPKIAVTIPTKRRPQLTTEPPHVNPVIVEANNEPIEVVPDLKEPEPEKQSVVANETKQFFKRIRPPVQISAKKSRNRPASLNSEVSKPAIVEAKLNEIQPKELVENPIVEPITVQQRVATPPPPSPVKPTPSPVKVPVIHRFARPAVSESHVRRHSVHVSSASESEDDTRRNAISRMRKLSESSVGAKTIVLNEEAVDDPVDVNECVRLALLPKKRKAKVSNHVRRIAEARRNFNRRFSWEKPDRSNLKMFDLLFYNPNPPDENKVPEPKSEIKTFALYNEQQTQEEAVDDPEKDENGSTEMSMPVPQVKIGANGEIILDEKSLVIETTDARKGREALKNSVPVFEEGSRKSSYYGKKHNKHKDWSPVELKCFYKALNSIGTDFALMESLFPGRSRSDLKNKFKREEKQNRVLIDKALGQPASFNITMLHEEFERERAIVEKETQKKLQEMERLQKEKRDSIKSEFKAIDEMLMRKKSITSEPIKQIRRSERKSTTRKYSTDFVDNFESDENENSEKTINPKRTQELQKIINTPKINNDKICLKNQDTEQIINTPHHQTTNENETRPTPKIAQRPVIMEEEISTMETVLVLQEELPERELFSTEDPSYNLEAINHEPMNLVEESLNQRSIGGLSYTIIKTGNEDLDMSQLQSMKIGSIIVRICDAPSVDRYRVYMTVGKESESGKLEIAAIPALLPVDLMSSIINDMNECNY